MTSTIYTVAVERQFANTDKKIIPLASFGGINNDAVEILYQNKNNEGGKVQQVYVRNTGTFGEPLTISYILTGNNQVLGNISPTAVPDNGAIKQFLNDQEIYFSPSGELDTEYSPIANMDTLELQDLSINIGNLTYSFDMMNKNINGVSNVILMSGIATVVEL